MVTCRKNNGFRRGKRIEQHLPVGIPALVFTFVSLPNLPYGNGDYKLVTLALRFCMGYRMYPNVTDLQVADNILPFAQLAIEKGKLLDSLVAELSAVGFVLNADKNGLFDKLTLTAFNNHD